MMVWNKADMLDAEEIESLLRTRGGVAISAARREGLSTLLAKADTTLFAEGASRNLGVVADEASLAELASVDNEDDLEQLPEEASPTLGVG
jgi:GTP-binding protein HflX